MKEYQLYVVYNQMGVWQNNIVEGDAKSSLQDGAFWFFTIVPYIVVSKIK